MASQQFNINQLLLAVYTEIYIYIYIGQFVIGLLALTLGIIDQETTQLGLCIHTTVIVADGLGMEYWSYSNIPHYPSFLA